MNAMFSRRFAAHQWVIHTRRMFKQILFSLTLVMASAALAGNFPTEKYQSIVNRNPFGLKDPLPAPITPPETPKPVISPLPKLLLTGIAYVKGVKKAYLLNPEGVSYDQKFLNFSLGQRIGDLQLQEVDVKARKVKLVYAEQELWLSMKSDDPTSFFSKPRIGGEPKSIAFANIKQTRIPRSTLVH